MLAFSGFSWALRGVMICPALLKSRSEGEDVAWTDKYRLAKGARLGKFFSWSFHHSNGSSSQPAGGMATYKLYSLRNFSRGELWAGDEDCSFEFPSQEPRVRCFFRGGESGVGVGTGFGSLTVSLELEDVDGCGSETSVVCGEDSSINRVRRLVFTDVVWISSRWVTCKKIVWKGLAYNCCNNMAFSIHWKGYKKLTNLAFQIL